MAHFESEELSGKVEKDMDEFLTIRFKLKLIDEDITALVLCMDRMDAMDMLKSLNTTLQTTTVKLLDCLIICVCRQFPDFVNIDPDFKIDPISTEPICKDEILSRMITNYHVNNCGIQNYNNYNRYELIRTTN